MQCDRRLERAGRLLAAVRRDAAAGPRTGMRGERARRGPPGPAR